MNHVHYDDRILFIDTLLRTKFYLDVWLDTVSFAVRFTDFISHSALRY